MLTQRGRKLHAAMAIPGAYAPFSSAPGYLLSCSFCSLKMATSSRQQDTEIGKHTSLYSYLLEAINCKKS